MQDFQTIDCFILVVFRFNLSMIIRLFLLLLIIFDENNSLYFVTSFSISLSWSSSSCDILSAYVWSWDSFYLFMFSVWLWYCSWLKYYSSTKRNYHLLSLCFNYHHYNCLPRVTFFLPQYDYDPLFYFVTSFWLHDYHDTISVWVTNLHFH